MIGTLPSAPNAWCASTPIGAAVAAPFLGATRPEILPIIALPWVCSALILGIQRALYPMPRIPDIFDVRPGWPMMVRGAAYRVLAKLTSKAFRTGLPSDSLFLLADERRAGEPCLAVVVQHQIGNWAPRAYAARSGGDAWTGGGNLAQWRVWEGSAVVTSGGADARIVAEGDALRLWVGNPRPSEPARLTLVAWPTAIDADDLVFGDAAVGPAPP